MRETKGLPVCSTIHIYIYIQVLNIAPRMERSEGIAKLHVAPHRTNGSVACGHGVAATESKECWSHQMPGDFRSQSHLRISKARVSSTSFWSLRLTGQKNESCPISIPTSPHFQTYEQLMLPQMAYWLRAGLLAEKLLSQSESL